MDELTAQQRNELLGDLEDLRHELEGTLALSREGTKPVDADEPIGRISRGDALQQQQMARASKRSNELRLKQVSNALDAHRKGTYGLCRLCEEPIGFARLKARPETPFCLTCQEESESR